MEKEPRYMRTKTCAKYTTLSENTVRRYVHMKQIPHIKQGSCILFDRYDIDAWLEKRKVTAIVVPLQRNSEMIRVEVEE